MKITFENNILYLPIVEAKEIKEGLTVPLLFEMTDYFIHGTKINFDFRHSDSVYPSVILDREKITLAEKYFLNSASCQINEQERTITYQLAQFWHYLGDGTHHSEFVPTPFGFYPGLTITIENRYNVKPTNAIVKNIKLTRVNEEKWLWLVEIQKL